MRGISREREGLGISWYSERSYLVAEGPKRVRSRDPNWKDWEEAVCVLGGWGWPGVFLGGGSSRVTRWVPEPEV